MMNRRHAMFKALRKTWWNFFCATVMMAAAIYCWSIDAAPWWAVAVGAVVVFSLTVMQVAENYGKVKRDHFHF